jgi:hypothetical protein
MVKGIPTEKRLRYTFSDTNAWFKSNEIVGALYYPRRAVYNAGIKKVSTPLEANRYSKIQKKFIALSISFRKSFLLWLPSRNKQQDLVGD